MKNLTQLIEKARNQPAMAPIHALEIDRQLRGMGKAAITFSAHGLAEGSIATAQILKLDHLFTAQAKPEGANAIYQAEMLVKEGKRSEAIAHAFAHAQGPQVNSLNLFYANHATQRPEIRRYYLNKYLSAYGLRIELEQGEHTKFFNRLNSGKTFEKVDGPLVTVIMPAHNAEATIELAVNSLLNQSWHNLQIIIVDDASTDSTLQKAKVIAKRDPRVEVLSNLVNVGAYVSRNFGVLHTRGEWLTVHDADDWAFPDRIKQQVKAITDAKAHTCTGGMLRMNAQGQITRPSPSGANNEDGYQRLCFVSMMVQAEFFRKELGAWDSVRVGGDAEMIARLKVLGAKSTHLGRPLMLCLDHAAGLTNHAELGLVDEDGRVSQVRSDYRQAYENWHQSAGSKKLSPYAEDRDFKIPIKNHVDRTRIEKVFSTKLEDSPLEKRVADHDYKIDYSNKETNYLADIIIPHHDRVDLLERCLKLIDRSLFNVIVSQGGTFAENCNKGALNSLTDNLIFLNDDTEIQSELLCEVAKSQADLTGVAQRFPNKNQVVYGLGVRLLESGCTERYFARNHADICIPSGYFFGIKKQAWIQIGGFDEHFMNGGEDADLFMRCIEKKFSFSFIEKAGLHLHSQSTGRNDRDDYNRALFNFLWPLERLKKLFRDNADRLAITDDKKIVWNRGIKNKSNFILLEKNEFCPYCDATNATDEHILQCKRSAPLVSVVIPSRVNEKVISIQSLNLQTYKNLQIIVEYDRNQEGASITRNNGLLKAIGEYIFFCDNDIILNPNAIAVLVRNLNKTKKASWAFGKFYLDGKLRNQDKTIDIPRAGTADWVDYFTGISTMSLVRAGAEPRFDPEMKRFNDWDLWLTLHKKGFKPIFCDHVLFVSKNHKSGISSRGNADRIKWTNRLYAKHDVYVFNEFKKKNEIIKNLQLASKSAK